MNLISEEGVVKAAFTCKTKDLKVALKFIKACMKKTRMRDEWPYLELTIKTDKVEFVVAGARKSLKCEAMGPARLNISFAYFVHLVNDRPKIKTSVSVGEGFITINETTTYVDTWFFQDDSILRSINLPVNYGMADLLRMSLKYTDKEIAFNKLSAEYVGAIATLAIDAKAITARLKKYGISKNDIEKFIHDKIFVQSKS